MGKHGPQFYDDPAVFRTHIAAREERPDNSNDTLEQPILRSLAGDLAGRRILDLGCGAAAFRVHALSSGAQTQVGVDGSSNMVASARWALSGTAGGVLYENLEMWDPALAAFDLVVSSLVLHYLADVGTLFARVCQALVPGGQLVFSVEHPVIASSGRSWSSGQRRAWLVDEYFDIGPRETSWLGGRAVKHHRTVEGYLAALQGAEFVVDGLRESHPD